MCGRVCSTTGASATVARRRSRLLAYTVSQRSREIGVPDLATILAAVALVVLMTLVGSLVPAQRAVQVDPTRALKAE